MLTANLKRKFQSVTLKNCIVSCKLKIRRFFKMKRTKNDVILRIQKLSINAGRNEKLIKKWERILRKFD